MFYIIFDELFSSKSPNTIYSKALEQCIKHPKVIDALGEPIKAYGEESRRGRRSHIRWDKFILVIGYYSYCLLVLITFNFTVVQTL